MHCFKENSACSNGDNKLDEVLQILREKSSEEDPFAQPTDSDVEDACHCIYVILMTKLMIQRFYNLLLLLLLLSSLYYYYYYYHYHHHHIV